MKILEIIKTIKKEELCHRLRIGLVSYRDHPPEDTSFVTRKFELTPDTHKIEDNVVKMQATGGGDGPEAVCDDLNAANRMEFLLDAAKVVVLVGDAPPHGVEPLDMWPFTSLFQRYYLASHRLLDIIKQRKSQYGTKSFGLIA